MQAFPSTSTILNKNSNTNYEFRNSDKSFGPLEVGSYIEFQLHISKHK